MSVNIFVQNLTFTCLIVSRWWWKAGDIGPTQHKIIKQGSGNFIINNIAILTSIQNTHS